MEEGGRICASEEGMKEGGLGKAEYEPLQGKRRNEGNAE